MRINQQCLTCVFCLQLIRNLRARWRIDSSSIIAHPVNFDIPWERSLTISYQELDIYWYYRYKQFDNRYVFSISIGNTNWDSPLVSYKTHNSTRPSTCSLLQYLTISHCTVWIYCMVNENIFEIINRQRSHDKVLTCITVVSNVLVDGIAPSSARTSAGSVMTKLRVPFGMSLLVSLQQHSITGPALGL